MSVPLFRGSAEMVADVIERSAEPSHRLSACIVGRHPAPHEMLDSAGDQRLELVVELGANLLGRVWTEAE